MRRLRLQHRIVIPFVAVALVSAGAAAAVVWSVAARALESRLRTQLVSAAGVMSRGDLALNPAILPILEDILGTAILAVDDEGRVLASSESGRRPAVEAAAREAVATRAPGDVDWMDCDGPCLVIQQPLQGRSSAAVVLVAETSDLATATSTVARAILLATGLSVVLIVLVGQMVVRRVMAPLDRLVQFVRGLSPGDRGRRADVGNDEIGTLAEAFNDMLDRLEHAQAALLRSEKLGVAGLLAARVAHDIRNPLSSMRMQTQLLGAHVRGTPALEATVASVVRDIDQVESVIRDLLELAHPGEPRREPTTLEAVIDDALRHMSPQLAHRRITVDVRLPGGPLPVAVDRERFKRALLNVIVNASDAMPTGGTLSIDAEATGGDVTLRICDDGVGLDPAVAARAFDPFVTTKRDGVGLGLVNAKAVVEGHGGTIRLEPRQPRGACVIIRLPRDAREPGTHSSTTDG